MRGRAVRTVTDIIEQPAQRAQMIHHQEVREVEVASTAADEMWSLVKKNKPNVCQKRK
jgi:hypothetical protein